MNKEQTNFLVGVVFFQTPKAARYIDGLSSVGKQAPTPFERVRSIPDFARQPLSTVRLCFFSLLPPFGGLMRTCTHFGSLEHNRHQFKIIIRRYAAKTAEWQERRPNNRQVRRQAGRQASLVLSFWCWRPRSPLAAPAWCYRSH